jgi:glycosyltransferase involved in cell wall biosynthesis
MKISVVSPVYRAEEMVDLLVSRIGEEVSKITDDYEIILVEDGGPDQSWQKIVDNCQRDKRVKGVKLSRNFGQHYAVTAGISKASGDYVVLMDCDLQDDPAHIAKLLQEAQKGYEVVFTRRAGRRHSAAKRLCSWLYNRLFGIFSDSRYRIDNGTLVMFSRKVAQCFLRLRDKDRLYIPLLKWVGFSNTTVEVEHHARHSGESSYGFLKLLKMGMYGWVAHSDKLLRLSAYTGFILAGLSILVGLNILARYFFFDFQPGWPSLIVAILFSTGLILMSVGVTGVYIGRIFEQTKDRPLYIIDHEINLDR